MNLENTIYLLIFLTIVYINAFVFVPDPKCRKVYNPVSGLAVATSCILFIILFCLTISAFFI